MPSKPFYLSLTIVGALVHLFITLAALFGVDLGDQADAITKTIEQLTLAAGSLLATFSTIVGRLRARKPITLSATPAPVKTVLLLLTVGAAWTLSACAPLSAGSSATSTSAATSAGSTTVSKLASIGYTVANVLQTLNNGTTVPTVDQVLTRTGNSGDIATVNLVTSLVGQVAAAVVAAHNAGATTTQTQAAVNTVLAPASVAQTAANVAATTSSTPSN
jgi:hypothetical protein